ncbi:MAG: transposase [Acidobacteria bacterium]|nr:transposase [Acidobacteriota bacterium]
MSRTTAPQRSFADLEFSWQGVQLEPTLKGIADFLDTHASLVAGVQRDLTRGLSKPMTGRNGMNAAQVLWSLILMRVKNWDYRELRERIADGYTLRHFTAFDSHRVPKHDAFNRAFNRLTPDTLHAINAAVVQAAVALGVEDGTKLRVDTTVVDTDIHHPTDSALLWDSVRVLTRLVRHLADRLPAGAGRFTNRTRRARRRMQEIHRMAPKERPRHQVRKYRDLIRVAEQVVVEARAVVERTDAVAAGNTMTALAIEALRLDARLAELAEQAPSSPSGGAAAFAAAIR